MPRQNRRRTEPPRIAPRGGAERHEQFDGVAYAVRAISGQSATKPYRCPGCDQEVRPRVAHLVCWPADARHPHEGGAEDRRHWHSACWAARGRRAPGVQRSRSAPRY